MRGAVALGPALNPVVAQRLLDMGETTERLARARDVSLVDDSGRTARLVLRPVKTSHDREFAKQFYDDFQAVIAQHPPPDPSIRIAWIGGAHRHSVEDARIITQDLGWTSALSAIFVLGIVAINYAPVVLWSPHQSSWDYFAVGVFHVLMNLKVPMPLSSGL